LNNLNEIQKELIAQIKKYSVSNIEKYLEEDDETQTFRMEIFQGLSQLGVTGIGINEKYGGIELGLYDFSIFLQEIAKTSVSYAVTISVSNMVQSMIQQFGTSEQKENYLPSLTSGEEIAAFALSETSSGSDAIALKTKATKTDGGYLLNGSKMWITSGGIAKTYLVMARTSNEKSKGITAFIVRDGTEGFTYGKKENKLGWRSSPTRELIFENCFISDNQILGNIGDGFKIAMTALDKGRITIGSIAVGLANRSISEALEYTKSRKQFEKELIEFQGLQFMLAEMATETKASELLIKEAAQLYDQGQNVTLIASMAKLKATENSMKVSTDCVQMLGGVGFTKEFPLERYMRDAKGLQIVEGTNQIQKIVISRELTKG